MALSPKLELRQSQTLVMTPQLQQAIKLLQMSNIELGEYVEGELERNPLLEQGENDAGDTDTPTGVDAGDQGIIRDKSDPERTLDLQGDAPPAEAARDLDTDYDNVYDGDSASDRADLGEAGVTAPSSGWDQATRGGGFDGNDSNLEEFAAATHTLADHLHDQLQMSGFDAAQRLIGAYLIEQLDDQGYMRTPLEQIAEQLGAAQGDVEYVLGVCQGFEPTGVFARDLKECLSIQLKERDRLDPAMALFVENLELLARGDRAALRRICRVDDEDIAEMVQEVRALNPKPGLAYGGEPPQTVIPDAYVRQNPDGGWTIELNADTLPKVLVNMSYYATVSNGRCSKEDKNYLTDCLNDANWLVRSLEQRARTILKVATEIVRQQDAFFADGVQHLRPLTLKMVADAIDMHESTVSRVTANKYLSCSRGIFELKYFFTSAIANASGGEAHSSESVRHRIKTLIEAESPAKILSDDKIVRLLRAEGVDIARRTVAKYREAMNIPSSVERRRLKRAS